LSRAHTNPPLPFFTVVSPAPLQAYPHALDERGLTEAMRTFGKLESVMDKHYDELIVSGSFFFSIFLSLFFLFPRFHYFPPPRSLLEFHSAASSTSAFFF
jgi:hypothetical protein